MPRHVRQRLLDLRRVAMGADTVAGDALIALGEVEIELGCPSRAGYPALAVDDDAGQIEELPRYQRGQTEDGSLRIAAGIGDQLGISDLLAVQLRQAIHRLRQVSHVLVTV